MPRPIVRLLLTASLMLVFQVPGVAQSAAQDKRIHLNQIQVVGTHNSYHLGFGPNEFKFWQEKNPKLFRALEYRHRPLAEQLSGGVRQIEIDIYADSKGGLLAHPAILKVFEQTGVPLDPPFDPNHEMDQPGFKVLHVNDVDYRSSCLTFKSCLQIVRTWSQAHAGHLPIFILVETKQGSFKSALPTIQPEPFTPEVFDALDAEILSVFPVEQIITPDQVRGKHDTLEEAVRADGWPTLAQARGKVIFLMDQKPMGPVYLQGHPSLRKRILFTNATPGTPDAAFIEQNDDTPEAISTLVRQGYLVRTRTDDGTEQARTNDTKRRDAALASGAQMLSTDYPGNEPASWPGNFSVQIPGGLVARCNPVLKPVACDDRLLDPVPASIK